MALEKHKKDHIMIKTFNTSWIHGIFQLIKKKTLKYPSHKIFTCEKWKAFPLKSGTKQGCPLSTLLFNVILKVLARAIKGIKKELKGTQIGKEEVKFSLFVNDMILCIKNSKQSQKEKNY